MAKMGRIPAELVESGIVEKPRRSDLGALGEGERELAVSGTAAVVGRLRWRGRPRRRLNFAREPHALART